MASLESIAECGVTLTEPLKKSACSNQCDQCECDQAWGLPGGSTQRGPRVQSRSNSRLALIAKTIGKSHFDQMSTDHLTFSHFLPSHEEVRSGVQTGRRESQQGIFCQPPTVLQSLHGDRRFHEVSFLG